MPPSTLLRAPFGIQRRSHWIVAGLTLASAVSATDAHACGGLFCANSNPVNQAAERIIFAQNSDDTVSAVIEIQYEGPAHEFGWLIPVPAGDVEVGVSSKQTLDALQQASNPVFNLQAIFDDCGVQRDSATSSPNSGAGYPLGDSGEGGVSVIAQGTAGPYIYVQLRFDASLDDPADVALTWLEDNDFDVPDIGPDVLRPYLEEKMDLLAFKLSKSSGSGSVRPIFLNYAGQEPVIPIRPTAVAALEDMGIMVWVLGKDRAIPKNYLHLELNEAKIDWFNPQATYNDVVIAAADEAGGQGFVTEQSGPASDFQETLYASWKEEQWEQIRGGQFSTLRDFLVTVRGFAEAPFLSNSGFGPPIGDGGSVEQYDGFLDVISNPEILPLREGATAEQFNGCIDCYFQENVPVRTDAYPDTPYVPGEDPIESMDVQAFLAEIERLVIQPLRDTQALFDTHKTVTRFYTTLSPAEMTTDPVFSFNPDLPPVSNVHIAEQHLSCDGDGWTIVLPQGTELTGQGRTWPVSVNDGLPMNYRVAQLSTSGGAEIVTDNGDLIVTTLRDEGLGGGVVEPSDDVMSTDGDQPDLGHDNNPVDDSSSSGCSLSPVRQTGLGGSGFWALLVLGAALRRRRR